TAVVHDVAGIAVAVPVAIGEPVPVHDLVVDDPVAVVVGAVAVLGGAGPRGGVAVVAVAARRDAPDRLHAGGGGGRRVPPAVGVAVDVPGGAPDHARIRVVGGAVAIVVDAVADLRRPRVHLEVGVVAVGGVDDRVPRLRAGLD